MSAKQLKRQTVDFNAFRKEYRAGKQPILIEIGDETVEFPAEMPASVMLDLMAYMRDGEADAEIPTDLAVTILTDLMGGTGFQDLVRKHALDMHEMMWLFGQIIGVYMSDEALQGNALKPLQQPSISSPNGHSSKRTSRATTESS